LFAYAAATTSPTEAPPCKVISVFAALKEIWSRFARLTITPLLAKLKVVVVPCPPFWARNGISFVMQY
jgi:hypothetical protein